jgi:hypothetical protein
VLALLVLGIGTARAQEPAITVGTVVRVRFDCPFPHGARVRPVPDGCRDARGALISSTPDTIALSDGASRLALAHASIDTAEIVVDRHGQSGKGAIVGSLVGFGAAFGLVAGATDGCTESKGVSSSRIGACFAVGFIGALGGALLGAIIGSAFTTERWVSISRDRLRLDVRPSGDGRVSIAARLRL